MTLCVGSVERQPFPGSGDLLSFVPAQADLMKGDLDKALPHVLSPKATSAYQMSERAATLASEPLIRTGSAARASAAEGHGHGLDARV